MKNLRSKRGASLTEFLILAPVLVLLTYVTWDLNHRLHQSQNTVIEAHEMLKIPASADLTSIKKRVANSQTDLTTSDVEKSQLASDSNNLKTDYGVKVKIEDYKDLDNNGLVQPGGVDIKNKDGSSSALNGFSSTTGTIASASSDLVDLIQDSGSGLGLFIPESQRQVTIALRTDGKKNLMQKGIALMSHANRTPNGEINLIDRVDFRRPSLLVDDGYHTLKYENPALFGMLFGQLASHWGNESKKADSDRLQSRCMTRFNTDNSCNNWQYMLTGVSPGNHVSVRQIRDMLQLDRSPVNGSFPQRIALFAKARWALSLIAELLEKIPITAAVGIADGAMSDIGKAVIDQISEQVLSELADILIDQAMEMVDEAQEDLLQSFESQVQEMINKSISLPTNQFKNIYGDETNASNP